MNPYQPPLSIDTFHLLRRDDERAKRRCCPVCGCASTTTVHRMDLRKEQCNECKTNLHKAFPLWVNLSTVLSYLSGFLLFTSIRQLGRFEKTTDFWELYFYAATLLIIVPHLICGALYRRNYRLVVASAKPSHETATTRI